eukprot:COSAG01_NODE_5452_length_4256_cov_3.523454_6_plen_213_part_00
MWHTAPTPVAGRFLWNYVHVHARWLHGLWAFSGPPEALGLNGAARLVRQPRHPHHSAVTSAAAAATASAADNDKGRAATSAQAGRTGDRGAGGGSVVELPKAWAPWVPAAHGVELLELQAHILAHVARAQRSYDEAVLSVAAGGQWPSEPAWLRREWGRPQLVRPVHPPIHIMHTYIHDIHTYIHTYIHYTYIHAGLACRFQAASSLWLHNG